MLTDPLTSVYLFLGGIAVGAWITITVLIIAAALTYQLGWWRIQLRSTPPTAD